LLRGARRLSRHRGDGAAAGGRRQGARPGRAAAHPGARSLRRGHCQQHRSGPGTGRRRGCERAVHRRAVRLHAREGRARARHRLGAGGAAAASRRSSVMADQTVVDKPALLAQPRVRIGILIVVLIIGGVVAWLWITAGHESTDDAQIDSHVTQVAARVGGTITKVLVDDNQTVDAGAVLVELDPRDYQVAVDKMRAELADAQASALAAQSTVPITSATATSNVTTARGGVTQAQSGVAAAEKEVEAARARLVTAHARLREAEANATKAGRDVERLRGLLA